MFLNLVISVSVRQGNKSELLRGIKPQIFKFPKAIFYQSATKHFSISYYFLLSFFFPHSKIRTQIYKPTFREDHVHQGEAL